MEKVVPYTVAPEVTLGVRVGAVVDERVRVLLAVIHEGGYTRSTLENVSVSVNLSISRLCHLFGQEFGLGPLQYAKVLRLREAKELVESTFLRIQEIEVILGFKDSTRFVKDFKMAYGLTPARHRARHRAEVRKND